MITLIIVDCQNDFISGTLRVESAKDCVENIKEYIKEHHKEIDKIVFTCDWHPYNHCSFKKYDGQWPSHCVQFTPGACIEPKLLKLVQSLEIDYEVFTKGMEEEEYGAFYEITKGGDFLGKFYYLGEIRTDLTSDFVVCGIAGDYCVKATIQNLLDGGIIPTVFMNGIVSIDDGTTLNKFIKDKNLETI